MTREEKIAEARRLKAEGLSDAAIARRFGVTRSCVFKWLNPARAKEYGRRDNARPERKARKLAIQNEVGGSCPDCGGPLTKQAIWPRVTRCRDCYHAACREAHRERDEQIVKWWNDDGLSLREIAERLGWSVNHVQQEIWRLRYRYGYYLAPRRSDVGQRKVAA